MILFIDTETTGLPINWNAPISDTNNWPRMVQLAYLAYDDDGTLLDTKNFIIKPDGYIIPQDVSLLHGITTERALREGVELETILESFDNVLSTASLVVAHNMEFDEKVLGCEFFRVYRHNPLSLYRKFCTMKDPNIINYCAITPIRFGSYKWPKLSELHLKLFGNHFPESHNALEDIRATARCFWELRRRRIILSQNISQAHSVVRADRTKFGKSEYKEAKKTDWGVKLFLYGLVVTIIFIIALLNGFNNSSDDNTGLTYFFGISGIIMFVGLFRMLSKWN